MILATSKEPTHTDIYIYMYTERVLLGDVFHAKKDAKTLCFTVISCKSLGIIIAILKLLYVQASNSKGSLWI